MICVSVMYPNGPGKTFDYAYYREKHRPLVMERLATHGITAYEIDQAVEGTGAPYACIGRLYFSTVAEFQEALPKHGPELTGDIPNFTNIQPVFQISETV